MRGHDGKNIYLTFFEKRIGGNLKRYYMFGI
jgi:hypothetical protein